MPPRRKYRLVVIAAATAIVLVAALGLRAAAPLLSATAFVMDLSGQQSGLRRWLPTSVVEVHTEDLTVPTRHGPVTGRLYVPEGLSRRTVMVVPGLHSGGVDEPRLDHMASRLSAQGLTVLSLPLPDLREFRVTPRSTDMVEDAARWLSDRPDHSPSGRITLVGVSFGGGLSLVAAGRPSVENRLEMVVSIGGHGDLARVIRYLCTGQLADGTSQPANDYGAVIVLLDVLPRLVPADQIPALQHAVRTFLDASVADGRGDPALAAALFAESRRLGESLPDPARAIMADVNARDVSRLGPRLLPYAEEAASDPALSPERSPVTRAPVFLLHGVPDDVIPQTETSTLAAHLTAAGNTTVSWLLTPALSHADASPEVASGDLWRLIRFWARMLSAT